jgi:hypothetical protein
MITIIVAPPQPLLGSISVVAVGRHRRETLKARERAVWAVAIGLDDGGEEMIGGCRTRSAL